MNATPRVQEFDEWFQCAPEFLLLAFMRRKNIERGIYNCSFSESIAQREFFLLGFSM
jgi:hypothetical protein